MKKTVMTIGIVLVAGAVICLGLSWFNHWMAGSVMDGSASFYEKLFRRQNIFLYSGIGLLVVGAILLIISYIRNN